MPTKPAEMSSSMRAEEDRKAVVELAQQDHRVHEGELEIDDNAVVSWGSDNGAYVQAWLWIGFDGTPLDRHAEAAEPAAQ